MVAWSLGFLAAGASTHEAVEGFWVRFSGQERKKKGEKKKKKEKGEREGALAHVLQVDSRDFVHVLKAHDLQVDSRDVVL